MRTLLACLIVTISAVALVVAASRAAVGQSRPAAAETSAGASMPATAPAAVRAGATSPATAASHDASVTAGLPDPTAAPSPKWIWGPAPARANEERFFRVTFDAGLPAKHTAENPSAAWLWAAADDEMTVYLNGKLVARSGGWSRAVVADVRALLAPGENVLAVRCRNDTGPGALAVKLEVRGTYREPFRLVTDGNWKTMSAAATGWRGKSFGASKLDPARVLGDYGMPPWGEIPMGTPSQATPVEHIALPPGFKAELIYSVPRSAQGSWVSMTPDPKGRLYVSDQGGPLFRVTPAPPGAGAEQTKVEPVDLDIGHAQGLLWAFDSLYVVVNATNVPRESGLYRLRDTDGDDKLDQVTTLKKFSNRTRTGAGHGEHGPHAVVLGPDQKLYVVAGNFTDRPADLAPTSPARHWAEDLLLARMTDGRGHDPTIYAPGAWVARTDADGKAWELLTVGMRNAYDIAFDPRGELFTFDSDMEWDIGTPWWRPIRVYHLVSGGEYGWRNGSAKWPAHYPDAVKPVLDMGVGSPTGVTFGTGAKFPEKYQRAFFVSDWAYGKIFAVHLRPDGAGYAAEAEPFLVGKPFDVTDVVINRDGAMYVTIGGRGTQSGLYRITYVGEEPTAPAPMPGDDPPAATQARALRRKLESFHGRRDAGAVDIAWPHLSSDDRAIRYAARVAIEAQEPAAWTERALKAESPREAINALVALCRVGNPALQPRVLAALAKIDLAKLPQDQLLEALRAYQLCFIRMGRPTDGSDRAVAARLDALYPHERAEVNRELAQLLVYLNSPGVIEKSLALLAKATTQEEQLFYAFNLRNVEGGWTLPQRQAYFRWLNRAQQNYTGGASYKLFLANVRADAVRTLSDREKAVLADVIKPPMELAHGSAAAGAPANVPARKFVRNWQMAELTPALGRLSAGRSYENGRAAYAAVSCVQCHRFNGEGGGSGPDITGVGNRFQPADLLEAIVLPSKVISDQYQATQIVTKKKQVVVGTVHEESDEQVVIRPSPLSTHTESIAKRDILERRPSKLSIMPQGLLDVLSEEEVLDLLAYLRSAGDPKDPAFRAGGAAPANQAGAAPAPAPAPAGAGATTSPSASAPPAAAP